jgi:hypothetical protein
MNAVILFKVMTVHRSFGLYLENHTFLSHPQTSNTHNIEWVESRDELPFFT